MSLREEVLSFPCRGETLFGVLSLPEAEAFIAPAQINYVGKAANIYDQGYVYHGSASVILRYLRMGYLWERVRVRGEVDDEMIERLKTGVVLEDGSQGTTWRRA